MSEEVKLTVRMPENVRFALAQAANDAERSMNAELLFRLKKSLRADGHLQKGKRNGRKKQEADNS